MNVKHCEAANPLHRAFVASSSSRVYYFTQYVLITELQKTHTFADAGRTVSTCWFRLLRITESSERQELMKHSVKVIQLNQLNWRSYKKRDGP